MLIVPRACLKGLEERVSLRGEELQAQHISAVRNVKDWLDPMGLILSKARHRAADQPAEAPEEIAQCFIFVKGDALTRRQVDMMSATPEAAGV